MSGSAFTRSLLAYRALNAGPDTVLGPLLPDWAWALRWLQWAPPVRPGSPWLTLGLSCELPARRWPRAWRAPDAEEAVPLHCVPAPSDGIAQSWLRVSNTDTGDGEGTLGGFMRTRGAERPLLALTAGHVVAATGQAQRLDNIRFQLDEQTVAGGRLQGWAPSFDASGLDTSLDAAAIRLDEHAGLQMQARSSLPRGAGAAAPNQALRLLSRDGAMAGRAVGLLSAFMRLGEDDLIRYRLVDGLCYTVDGGSEAGDSGAAVWDAQDRLVALHTGSAPHGAAGNAMATPINRVLNWFGGDLVTRSDTAAATTPSTPPAAPALHVLPAAGAVSNTTAAPAPEPSTAVDVLARTMWGEARGEHTAGMEAVAHVVLNRRDARRWWGSTIEAVCQKPFQFSCWNEGDRNRGQLLRVAAGDAEFAAALRIARTMVTMAPTERARADITNGATHYHARGLTPLPNWARGKTPCQQIGGHVFYRGIA